MVYAFCAISNPSQRSLSTPKGTARCSQKPLKAIRTRSLQSSRPSERCDHGFLLAALATLNCEQVLPTHFLRGYPRGARRSFEAIRDLSFQLNLTGVVEL